ncbi:MAG: hypothetical protein IPK82_40405 [Polyangiaceae bacterium]|nr:hypothetical protein [Polyangiaceae bacterium]
MRRPRFLSGLILAAAATLLATTGGCQQPTTDQALRALEQSGRISFICLGAPEDGAPVLPLRECRNIRTTSACDFGSDGGAGGTAGTGGSAGNAGTAGSAGNAGTGGGAGSGGSSGAGAPHLYGLVTQTIRGEVAVLDFTTEGQDKLIDQDPTVPGPSFLPVGRSPVGIVSTPGSTATFVTVAEVGRPGIFAIPSSRLLRPRVDAENTDRCTNTWSEMPAPPRLSSWPSCSLPAAPGEPMLVNDPADEAGLERASCDGSFEDPILGSLNGDLTTEGQGRQKLIVPLPSEGGFAVIDAQKILDMPDGSFEPCPIDLWVKLDTAVASVSPPLPPTSPGCTNPEPAKPSAATDLPLPGGMAFADNTLYLADLGIPLIHRYAMASACEPLPLLPLLPSSVEEPSRVVTTDRLAVTPRPTAGLKSYLYATDVGDRSVMVFDVSPDATSLTPLLRDNPEWNPTEPRDRIRFSGTPRDIIVVSRDVPLETPGTGVAPEGIFCSPDPDLTACKSDGTTPNCDPQTLYRTASDFSEGAGPYKLRGTFAFALLTNGEIDIIDIEDLDGACRGPNVPAPQYGCDTFACKTNQDCPGTLEYTCSGATAETDGFCERVTPLISSAETSCNAVQANTRRSGNYILDDTTVGNNNPGLAAYPLLFDKTGAFLETSDPAVPVMRATFPPSGTAPEISVTGIPESVSDFGSPGAGVGHILVMNLETPRAHPVNQAWAATFEGALPRLGTTGAELRVKDGDPSFVDPAARYCDGGVQSFEAVRTTQTDAEALLLADRVSINNTLADQESDYWDNNASCNYDLCRATFGDPGTPGGRDFMILEAYQDRLILEDAALSTGTDLDPQTRLGLAKCCFPTLVTYLVRPNNQWTIVGEASGFLHHVIADPETGVCRPSCDPTKTRMNGRALRTPNSFRDKPVSDNSDTTFLNPSFRFAIVDGKDSDPGSADPDKPQRDMQIRWSTQGAFIPLVISLITDSRDIAPVGITYIPPTGELAITDGSLQGVLTVNLSAVSTARQFF